MRKVGHDRRLPIVVPVGATSFAGLIPCPDCQRGYATIRRELSAIESDTTWTELVIPLESEHAHTFGGDDDWQVKTAQRYYIGHCHKCHEYGERGPR